MEGITTKKHKETIRKAEFAIVTVTDTRNFEQDESGQLIKELVEKNGHTARSWSIVPDDIGLIQSKILSLLEEKEIDIIITNGGTGISDKDLTIDAVEPLLEIELTGFSTIYSMLSYKDIGSAAIMSRAKSGITHKKAIFCLPGSPKAVKLALEKLILPETNHIINHLSELKNKNVFIKNDNSFLNE